MLSATHLHKRHKNVGVHTGAGIHDASFGIQTGEVVCVLGPSGSGKSTLLRLLAGLETPDEGTVSQDTEATHPVYVAQEYTLWPHCTVLENLVLAPSHSGGHALDKIEKKALALLKRFKLEKHAHKHPHTLSGGERQRVAILRAVMSGSNVLLLDEITSALDPHLTKSVLDLIRALAKDGYTMVIVTHHMSFAMSVASRVLFLEQGKILQDANVVDFFSNQHDPKIQAFIRDIAKRDENIEVFKGVEQFQAYHLGLMKRLPYGSTIYVAGAVGDQWYKPMGDLYEKYEALRLSKRIAWRMVSYEEGETDRRLAKDYPTLNMFRKMPRSLQNPANYNVFGDTVITQIFDDEPVIIQVKSQDVADAYLRFFEELWQAANA